MGEVFEHKDSVFFVGGLGSKSGSSQAGGCTKEFYENNKENGYFPINKIMGSTSGGPIYSVSEELPSSATYTHSNHRVISPGGLFTDKIMPGMCVYIEGTNITSGIYEITDVDSGQEWIELEDIYATGDSGEFGVSVLNIGGAFDSFLNAINNTSSDDYNSHIFINNDENIIGSILGLGRGYNSASGTRAIVEGFNEYPEDLRTIDIENFESGMLPKIDGGGGSFSMFTLSSLNSYITFRCLEFTNISGLNYLINISSDCYSVVFFKCVINNMYSLWATSFRNVAFMFYNCFIYGLDNFYFGEMEGGAFIDSIFDCSGSLSSSVSSKYSCFLSCKVINGYLGVDYNTSYRCTINDSDNGILSSGGNVVDNLININSNSGYSVFSVGGHGEIINNLSWSDQGEVSIPFYDINNSREITIDINTISSDPILNGFSIPSNPTVISLGIGYYSFYQNYYPNFISGNTSGSSETGAF